MSRFADPQKLPDYLNDELEKNFFSHTMTTHSAASLMVGFFLGLDDPLMDSDYDNDHPSPRELQVLRRLSPIAEAFAKRARYDLDNPVNGMVQVEPVGNSLRELEAIVRQVWWDTACFSDPHAAELRENAKKADRRDASQKDQIDYLAKRCNFDEKYADRWKRADLHKYTHRNGLRVVRDLDVSTTAHFEEMVETLGHVAIQCESLYSAALVRLVSILEKGPQPQVRKTLSQSFPTHEGIRKWFFSQIGSGEWLPILQECGLLDEDLNMITNEIIRAPVSDTARLFVRLLESGDMEDLTI